MAMRIARSMPGFSVIGATATRTSDLSGIESFPFVIGRGGIQPRLKLATPARNQGGKFGGLYFEERKDFGQGEFIEVEERERASLRLGRGGNRNTYLIGIELFNLRRGKRPNIGFLHHPRLGLDALLSQREATPARVAKKPKAIRRRLVARGPFSRFSHGVLKRGLRLGRIAGHQEAKAIELREIFGGNRHVAEFLGAEFTRSDASRQVLEPARLRALLWSRHAPVPQR